MKLALAAICILALAATPASARRLLAVDETNNLITFDSANPGTTLSSVAITGTGGSSILAMDIRVADKKLYALADDNQIYTINRATGVAKLFLPVALTGSNFAFDFNPTNTNLRIVSNDNTNYFVRFNAPPVALVQQANAAYAPGSGFGDPDIVGAAYTFNDTNPATGTTLFVIDSRNDRLATLNVATGALTSIGALGFNVGSRTSFDIFGDFEGYVLNSNSLYRPNLATGALTLIGRTDRTLFALTAAIPEPATWGMMILGFGAVGAAARAGRTRRSSVAA
jgi:hypothetical protein